MAERLGLMDGFKFGLGFFTAGLVFYIIVLMITIALFGSTLVGMSGAHW